MSEVKLLRTITSGKVVLIMLFLYYALFFMAYIIPSPISKAILENIPMDQVLDLQKDGYSAGDAMTFFSVLGEKGRSDYVRNLWTIDLIMPFLSAISFSLLIYYCTARIKFFHSWFKLLSLIPCITAILDYTENIVITSEVLKYPRSSEALIRIADICTRLKWNSISVTLLITALVVILFLSHLVFTTAHLHRKSK